MRGATDVPGTAGGQHEISIHAPHAGSDSRGRDEPPHPGDFNPRSPCGERQAMTETAQQPNTFQSTLPMRGATVSLSLVNIFRLFQSTLPMRGATPRELEQKGFIDISIHAPHAGSDAGSKHRKHLHADFNPRSPCGERLLVSHRRSSSSNFNPRSPCGERPYFFHFSFKIFDFNPRSPCGERRV